ncbi:MAG: helix-turn-helix transcriptional regulator [Clostridia bacterium]|nr:helix-turn-helix transcriptional regulator [Clostridia bacterium]
MRIYKSERFIPKKESIGIFCAEKAYSEPSHRHDFIELVYILEGEAEHRVDDTCFQVKRGDMIFINFGSIHSFHSPESFSYVNVCFSPELVGGNMLTLENAIALLSLTAFDDMRKDKNYGRISFSGEDRREVEFLLSMMLKETREGLPSSSKVVEHYMGILMTKMLRRTELGEQDGLTLDIWQELRDYIDENPNGELSLTALAQKSFYNPSYFSRMFKQKFGSSLTDYVRRRRVLLATQLLADTDLSVDEVIERVGFSDRSAFYHSFSKEMGMTPAEYRARRTGK